jgi:hypothetical protein
MNHASRPWGKTRLAARYVSGRPLDGRARTDSRFLVAGTRALTPTGYASRWAYRPGWQRAAYRLGVPAVLALTGTAELLAPVATEATLSGALVAGSAETVRRAVRGVRRWSHRRTYVQPLAAVLGYQLGVPPTTLPERWLYVPVDFRTPDYSRDPVPYDADDDAPATVRVRRTVGRTVRAVVRRRTRPDGLLSGQVRVMLPPVLPDSPDVQRAVLRTVAGKLGVSLGDVDSSWHMVGAEPYALFRRAPRPPKRVPYSTVRAAIDSARDSAPVLGLGARDKVLSVDFDSEAPHLGVSCGSGAGKSVLIRGLVAQFLARGVQVVILDGKRVSQSWCKDLPGVTYCRTGAEMHAALLGLQAEVDRRNEAIDSVPAEQEDTVDVGPRIVVVFEEQNVGMQMLTEHWAAIRGKDDPKRSPAISALDYVLCTGRQVKTHVVSVAQLFTVQASGGNPAARENYGARILGRATRNAWLMLAPEAGPPYPRPSRIRGRMHLVLGGTPVEFQTVFLTVAEARALATSGAVTVPAGWRLTPEQAPETVTAETVTGPARFTLAEASRQEWCHLDYAALRQRKRRAGESWPAGARRGPRETWTEGELRAALGLVDQDQDQDDTADFAA